MPARSLRRRPTARRLGCRAKSRRRLSPMNVCRIPALLIRAALAVAGGFFLALWPAVPIPPAAAQASCTFVLGFGSLRAMIPIPIGQCLENQYYAANGNAEQHTTGGLLVWRKADN